MQPCTSLPARLAVCQVLTLTCMIHQGLTSRGGRCCGCRPVWSRC
jgi:hypothetical protein